MATTFKTFLNDDVATTRTLLHEAIPISGGIVDDTVYTGSATNIKNYPHEMFQSVYDYTYTKSSANHIFDLTIGHTSDSDLVDAGTTEAEKVVKKKKEMIYKEFAQILAGHKADGTIRNFDADGDLLDGGTEYKEVYIISIARLLNKDEIKKGSFSINLDVGDPTDTSNSGFPALRHELIISDEGNATSYKVNSPAGDYGILNCRTWNKYPVDSGTGLNDPSTCTIDYDSLPTELDGLDLKAGLIFYQAGVVVLTPYIFANYEAGTLQGKLPGDPSTLDGNDCANLSNPELVNSTQVEASFQNESIPDNCTGFRKRINKIAFNNTTELNSTIYFCRVSHNDFNYSSNPTYLDGSSQIRVKETSASAPISYITTVGLYSADNELLAVAKLSEPLRKDPTNEMVLRVRLDY